MLKSTLSKSIFPRLNFIEIQNIIDQYQQVLSRKLQYIQIFQLLGLWVLLNKQMCKAYYRIHRCPDLMAHRRHELRQQSRPALPPLSALINSCSAILCVVISRMAPYNFVTFPYSSTKGLPWPVYIWAVRRAEQYATQSSKTIDY